MGTEVGMEDAALTLTAAGVPIATPDEAGVATAARLDGKTAPADGADPLRAVRAALRDDAASFEFFQAVRLLERLNPERAPVGRFVDPADEVVRFGVGPSIAFPPAAIQALEFRSDDAARMDVAFMGLTGPLGVLPHHYTLLVAERARARDGGPRAFLDLFHHRALSLFYRAWEHHRVAVAHEKAEDRLRAHVLDVVGMGHEGMRDLLPFDDDALVCYAGLIALQQRGAVALEQLLEDYFEVAVEVEQFVGAWYPVAAGDLCAVGEERGAATQLGRGAVVGGEVWDQQMRVRVRLGPLSKRQFDRFLPTGDAHEPLSALLRFFAHDQFDFEVQLVLARDDVPGLVLGADSDSAQPLGWSTWIRTTNFAHDADNTVLRLH
jgi:type VI secretion system protein ImpH